ncbi:MAG: RNA polymerase sigma factor [Actinobacteria bacterium]|nr:MAG: RNA polymerase sigma factor [Actinomycetota bacterium]
MASAALEIPAAARARDFELLYRRYAQDVYRYALALLRNPADAEDVTQTTFLNAYRAYLRGEDPIKPQNWLIKIAHNAARTRYARASRRVKEVPLDDHVAQLAVPEEDKPDVREVLEALGRLPLNQRAALVMRELEGRTYAEIAELLEVSVAAVETLIFRARRSLRLKASAVRTLAVVPLPSSLAQFFDAGGVVAGGGAVIGSGLLLKAAVAVVAGVVATGVGGDHSRNAGAAARQATQAGWGSRNEPGIQSDLAAGARAAGLAAVRNDRPAGAVSTARPGDRASADGSGVSSSPVGNGSGDPAAGSSGAGGAQPATTTAQVAGAVATVTQALPAVPPLPVDVPPLPQPPPLPVSPPPVPKLP